MDYEFHPIANEYPMMSEWSYRLLVEDIKKNGQRTSIALYDGKILDGRNRYGACIELGIDPKFKDSGCKSDEEARAFVESMNDRRRHESEDALKQRIERRKKVVELRGQGKSTRAIAEEVGVSRGAVENDLRSVGLTKTPAQPTTVKGRDGKTYQATRTTTQTTVKAGSEQNHQPRREIGPPMDGILFAENAILALEQIKPDDTQRAEAWELVRRWLDEHE